MTELVRMSVRDVHRLADDKHVVLLKEVDGARQLPIWIGPWEAAGLAFTLQSAELPRPGPFHLAARILEATLARMREARVVNLSDGTFYATVRLEGPGGEAEIDARPSDALQLALLVDAPISVDAQVLRAVAEQEASGAVPSAARLADDSQGRADAIVEDVLARWR